MLQLISAAIQNSWLAVLLTAVIAYLLGSISSAVLISRIWFREDVREKGSGNAGATNILRNYGKKAAILTTAGDLLKSVISVLVGGYLLMHLQLTHTTEIEMESLRIVGRYFAGMCCVLGHLYPVYFGFRGGKGVLTSLGMILILDIRVALMCLAIFAVVLLCSRMVSLGSVISVGVAPALVYVVTRYIDGRSMYSVVFCTVMTAIICGMVVFKHRSNIRRIIAGNENKVHF